MQFDEMGNLSGKTLMLLPGTACDYQIRRISPQYWTGLGKSIT